jgi:threonine/homoserine/homoserine lactone efflux protein
MEASFFIKGFLIGFSVAAPVGQIGALCIKRTLTEGRAFGFASGLGAATADMFYGMVAAFGITFIADTLTSPLVQFLTRCIGGLFICYLGIKTIRSTPPEDKLVLNENKNLFSGYISTFLLTITNPVTILLYTGIFAGLRIGVVSGDYLSATIMVAGVFLGSTAWWIILVTFVGFVRTRLTPKMMRYVNIGSGVVITFFGATALLTLLFSRSA